MTAKQETRAKTRARVQAGQRRDAFLDTRSDDWTRRSMVSLCGQKHGPRWPLMGSKATRPRLVRSFICDVHGGTVGFEGAIDSGALFRTTNRFDRLDSLVSRTVARRAVVRDQDDATANFHPVLFNSLIGIFLINRYTGCDVFPWPVHSKDQRKRGDSPAIQGFAFSSSASRFSMLYGDANRRCFPRNDLVFHRNRI